MRATNRAFYVCARALNKRLQTALARLKEVKPELFQITVQEQMEKLIGELTGTFLKWLISE